MDEILSRAGIFLGVQSSAVEALAHKLSTVDFPCGHLIFDQGDPGDCLYVISSGKVKIRSRSPGNKESLLALLGPSDVFGELAVFDPGPRATSATALTEVQALEISRPLLRAWIAERPEIAEQLLGVLARRLRHTNDNLADIVFNDVAGRVAKQLMALAKRFGTRQGACLRVDHDLTQDEIAQLIGATRVTVNKVFADFAHRGWIRFDGGTVWICNPERLAGRGR